MAQATENEDNKKQQQQKLHKINYQTIHEENNQQLCCLHIMYTFFAIKYSDSHETLIKFRAKIYCRANKLKSFVRCFGYLFFLVCDGLISFRNRQFIT